MKSAFFLMAIILLGTCSPLWALESYFKRFNIPQPAAESIQITKEDYKVLEFTLNSGFSFFDFKLNQGDQVRMLMGGLYSIQLTQTTQMGSLKALPGKNNVVTFHPKTNQLAGLVLAQEIQLQKTLWPKGSRLSFYENTHCQKLPCLRQVILGGAIQFQGQTAPAGARIHFSLTTKKARLIPQKGK